MVECWYMQDEFRASICNEYCLQSEQLPEALNFISLVQMTNAKITRADDNFDFHACHCST